MRRRLRRIAYTAIRFGDVVVLPLFLLPLEASVLADKGHGAPQWLGVVALVGGSLILAATLWSCLREWRRDRAWRLRVARSTRPGGTPPPVGGA